MNKDYDYTPYHLNGKGKTMSYADQTGVIYIPEDHTKLIIELSGGADSAAMAWSVLKYLRENDRILESIALMTGSDLSKPLSDTPAIEIFKHLESQFPEQNLTHRLCDFEFIWGDRSTLKVFTLREFEKTLFDEGYTAIVRASTVGPKKEIQMENGMWDNPWKPIGREKDEEEKFISRNVFKDRYKLFRRHLAGTFEYNGKTIYDIAPWFPNDKKFVAGVYDDEPYLKDNIYNLTISCVETDAKVTEFWTKPCKECWWCLEKKWAFGTYDGSVE